MGARLTEALIARAIRAARKENCKVVEIGDKDRAIRILVDDGAQPLASREEDDGEGAWEDRLGRSG